MVGHKNVNLFTIKTYKALNVKHSFPHENSLLNNLFHLNEKTHYRKLYRCNKDKYFMYPFLVSEIKFKSYKFCKPISTH